MTSPPVVRGSQAAERLWETVQATCSGASPGLPTSIGDWRSKALLERLAYVDITGLVINVDLASSEQPKMRQWGDAISHVFQPRFLFPDKQALSDTEVFIHLTKADIMENMRGGTSISVGYMAENYVDSASGDAGGCLPRLV